MDGCLYINTIRFRYDSNRNVFLSANNQTNKNSYHIALDILCVCRIEHYNTLLSYSLPLRSNISQYFRLFKETVLVHLYTSYHPCHLLWSWMTEKKSIIIHVKIISRAFCFLFFFWDENTWSNLFSSLYGYTYMYEPKYDIRFIHLNITSFSS